MLVAGRGTARDGGEDSMLGVNKVRTFAVRTVTAAAVCAIATIAFVSVTPERAHAYPSYVNSRYGLPALPAGYAYECSDCHVNPSGGGACNAPGTTHPYDPCFNPFGIQYRASGWSTALGNGDSDGDGIL